MKIMRGKDKMADVEIHFDKKVLLFNIRKWWYSLYIVHVDRDVTENSAIIFMHSFGLCLNPAMFGYQWQFIYTIEIGSKHFRFIRNIPERFYKSAADNFYETHPAVKSFRKA